MPVFIFRWQKFFFDAEKFVLQKRSFAAVDDVVVIVVAAADVVVVVVVVVEVICCFTALTYFTKKLNVGEDKTNNSFHFLNDLYSFCRLSP